ncbi:MAG: hypothetical protein FJX76_10555 [Armatimonadetes bacterium]|nr:hypothetical protein [Armatimonadota bacterium]
MEVVVASAIFAGVLLVIVLIQNMSRQAFTKTDVHAETFRQAANGVDHIRRELAGSRVSLEQTTADRLVFLKRPESSVPVVVAGGIDYSGAFSNITRTAGGDLVRFDGARNETRRLAVLGPSGAVRFALVGPRLLRVTVRAVIEKPQQSTSEITSEIYLGNQP